MDTIEQYTAILERVENLINLKEFPKLKILLTEYGQTFNNILDILTRKSLVKVEQYEYEDEEVFEKFIKLEETNFNIKDEPGTIGQRMNNVLKNFVYFEKNFSYRFPNFKIKMIEMIQLNITCFDFVNFESMGATINTRSLFQMCNNVKNSADVVIKTKISDIIKMLSKTTQDIQFILSRITQYLRVKTKYLIFKELSNHKTYNQIIEKNINNMSHIANDIKSHIFEHYPDENIFEDWITPGVKEYYTKSIQEIIENIAHKFLTEKETKALHASIFSPKENFIKILILLANLYKPLFYALQKLEKNLNNINQVKKSFFENILNIMQKMFSVSTIRQFKIQYQDPQSNLLVNTTINTNEFTKHIKEKAMLFKQVSNTDSKIFKKIQKATLPSLEKFFYDNLNESKLIFEKISSLNVMLKEKFFKKNKNLYEEVNKEMKDSESIITQSLIKKREYDEHKSILSGD